MKGEGARAAVIQIVSSVAFLAIALLLFRDMLLPSRFDTFNLIFTIVFLGVPLFQIVKAILTLSRLSTGAGGTPEARPDRWRSLRRALDPPPARAKEPTAHRGPDAEPPTPASASPPVSAPEPVSASLAPAPAPPEQPSIAAQTPTPPASPPVPSPAPAPSPPPPAAAVEGPRLAVVSGADAGKQHALGQTPSVVGRSIACQVVIDGDTRVAYQHVRLIRGEDGWTIHDAPGSGGTLVNGERLAAPRLLRPGDLIGVGQTELRFDAGG